MGCVRPGPRARARITILTTIVLLTCLTSCTNSARATSDIARRVGIAYGGTLTSMSDDDARAAIDDVVRLGGRWVRADLSWNAVEPEKGTRNWSAFDRVVHEAYVRGLAVDATIAYTPPWARVDGCDDERCRPADPGEFAAFAHDAEERYGSQGVSAWEVWNEPNSDFFQPTDSGEYARLLTATSAAIKSVNSSAVVVLGGLAMQSDPTKIQDPFRFLAEVCRLGGNKAVDGVAFHPYTFPDLASAALPDVTPWSHIAQAQPSLTGILAAAGSPHMPIWITEFGAPTGGPGSAADSSAGQGTTHVTEARQAVIADDVVRTIAADQQIAMMFWYSDRDLSDDASTNLNFYGLRRTDGTLKPAFDAFRNAVANN